jgi:hypothetical protein
MSTRGVLTILAAFLLSANALLLVHLRVIDFGTDARVQNAFEVQGAIADERGAFITAASVALNGNERGYSTESDAKGRFRFIGIQPGLYTLVVTAKGFAKSEQQVEVKAENIPSLRITLRVFIAEKIDVKSSAPSISAEPEKNLSSIVLTGADLQALPSDLRRMLEVLRQMACPSCRPDDVAIYVNGFRNNDGSRGAHRLPPKEVIEMIRIDANPFAAEFSEPGKGRIEITTKPGSDDYHGEVKFDYNDEALNARNALAPSRAPFQVRDYSGYFMGPVARNKWDYMVYAGRWEQNENGVVNATTVDPATSEPRTFSTTVVTPSRINNLTLHTNYLFSKKNTLGIEYSLATDHATNQGLQGGLELPERAFGRSSREQAFRFSLTSIANEHTINETRLELARRNSETEAVSSSPALLVLDAFNGGGNQSSLFNRNLSNTLQFTDNLTFTHNRHTLKTGVRVDAISLSSLDRSNFGGTFTFGSDFDRDSNGNIKLGANGQLITITPLENYRRTLLGIPGYQPSQFSIVRGNPVVGMAQWNVGWFAQDDWRLAPGLTLSFGLRHEFQTHLVDKLNFAPRAAIAWTPDKKQKSTVRAGGGIFYSAVFSDITLETAKLDGSRQREITIQRPKFFPNVPDNLDGATLSLPTIHMKSRNLAAPYSLLATVSYERQLPWKLFGSIGYTYQRGERLLRTRNINAPLASGARPFPDKGPILQFESTGVSERHELLLALRGNVGSKVTVFGNYALAFARSNTDDAHTEPANSYDLSSEFGRAALDQRHNFFFGGTVSLPWNVIFSPYLFVSSSPPFNITTGRDNNGDTLFTDRPAFAAPGDPGAIATRFGFFNPNPAPGDVIIPRNYGRGSGQRSVNVSFAKTFVVGRPSHSVRSATANSGGQQTGDRRRYNLALSVNAENLFNHTNLAAFNGVVTSPLFGRANRALGARKVEFALSFSF